MFEYFLVMWSVIHRVWEPVERCVTFCRIGEVSSLICYPLLSSLSSSLTLFSHRTPLGAIDVNLLWDYWVSNSTHPPSEAASAYAKSYAASVAGTGALGTGFAVMQGMFVVFFIIGRCFLNSCGGKEPR